MPRSSFQGSYARRRGNFGPQLDLVISLSRSIAVWNLVAVPDGYEARPRAVRSAAWPMVPDHQTALRLRGRHRGAMLRRRTTESWRLDGCRTVVQTGVHCLVPSVASAPTRLIRVALPSAPACVRVPAPAGVAASDSSAGHQSVSLFRCKGTRRLGPDIALQAADGGTGLRPEDAVHRS